MDFSRSSREDRLALLERIMTVFASRKREMGALISREMGAPLTLAIDAQAQAGYDHFEAARDTLREFEFEEVVGTTKVLFEPIGARSHHPVELADVPDRGEGRAGSGHRMHDGPEAIGGGTPQRDSLR
jgi:hypothetical protein